eukprot:2869142-Rhodomonas_salina.1
MLATTQWFSCVGRSRSVLILRSFDTGPAQPCARCRSLGHATYYPRTLRQPEKLESQIRTRDVRERRLGWVSAELKLFSAQSQRSSESGRGTLEVEGGSGRGRIGREEGWVSAGRRGGRGG